MWSDVDRVRVDFIRFQRFFLTVVGPTYNWFRGPHIRWDPLVGPVSPQWGPLVGHVGPQLGPLVGPTLLGPRGPRWAHNPLVGPVGPQWGPLVGPTLLGPTGPTVGPITHLWVL